MHEVRSGEAAQLTIEGVDPAPEQGVGARQPRPGPRRRGGGYLDELTSSNVWEVAKIRELEAMGMPGVWIEVARAIGYDGFMLVWAILDREVSMRPDTESYIEVKLRRLRAFQRFQRNRFIESLASAGLTDKQIRMTVNAELGENISIPHIHRLARGRRVMAK